MMRLLDADPLNVTVIDIRTDIITGQIPLGISHFTNLTYLHLANASVSGDVARLSALTSLTYLHLGNTSLT